MHEKIWLNLIVLYCTKWRCSHIERQLKVEIENKPIYLSITDIGHCSASLSVLLVLLYIYIPVQI